MKSSTSLRLLALAAVASPLLALWSQDPESDKADWAQHVEKACESRRFGIRLAAARKVAEGGDAAVPAVRAYAEKKGSNQLPVSLVDAIADGGQCGDMVIALLTEWARDNDFYWRSSALRGLAQRVGMLQGESEAQLQVRHLFRDFTEDPAWLMRTHARLGETLLGNHFKAHWSPEVDPRALVRLAALLLKLGKTPSLQPLFDGLADERTLLDDPWGQRLGAEAHKALKTWLGEDNPLAEGDSYPDKQQAIAALRDAAQKKSGQTIEMPVLRTDRQDKPAGGIEILSCKFGDQFVQWSADGVLRFGIDGEQQVQLPAEAFGELWQDRADIAVTENLGVVICDTMRVRIYEPDVHVKIAPTSLPRSAADWLKRLAQRIEEAGHKDLADALGRGLGQFVGP